MRRAAPAALFLCLFAIAAPACTAGSGGGGTGGATEAGGAIPFVEVDPSSPSPTDQAILKAQMRLRVVPGDEGARIELANAFLQKAREVADPTLYTKVDGLLADVDTAADPRALIAQGTLELARHRFADALDIGRRAVTALPGNEVALGVVVDASTELGRYDEARAATQAMVDARPNLSALSRVSYYRELHGDLRGALQAMTQAVTASGTGGENRAYVQVQLAGLQILTGNLDGAAATYAAAEASFPGFAPTQAGRAHLLVARAQPAEAAALLGEVLKTRPLAEYAIAQGDAFMAAGRVAEAQQSYELVDAIAKLYTANGVNVDLEMALFDADRRPGKGSVQRARKALASRPSIFGHESLAWNLFKAGDEKGAADAIKNALVTGSRDPRLRYHAAEIALATGDRTAAAIHLSIVLETNPRFSALSYEQVSRLARQLDLPLPPTNA